MAVDKNDIETEANDSMKGTYPTSSGLSSKRPREKAKLLIPRNIETDTGKIELTPGPMEKKLKEKKWR